MLWAFLFFSSHHRLVGRGMRRGDTRGPHVARNPEDPSSGKSQTLVNIFGERSKVKNSSPGRMQRSAPPPPSLTWISFMFMMVLEGLWVPSR